MIFIHIILNKIDPSFWMYLVAEAFESNEVERVYETPRDIDLPPAWCQWMESNHHL